jgi:hypothetical protein
MSYWQEGRQGTGYFKFKIWDKILFDLYLLKFKVGSWIPPHIDPVCFLNHYRLNIILKEAKEGGVFKGKCIFETKRIKFFRPDIVEHSVSTITKGSRLVLSIGFTTTKEK